MRYFYKHLDIKNWLHYETGLLFFFGDLSAQLLLISFFVCFIFQLAFAEQGMLYGVQMFAQNHGVKLESTTTEEAKVIWQVFHDR